MQNNNFLSRDRTQSLIDSIGVKQADGQAFLEGLAKQGYTIEGFNDTPTQATVTPLAKPGYRADTSKMSTMEKVANTVNDVTGIGDLAAKGGQQLAQYVASKYPNDPILQKLADTGNQFAPSAEQTRAAALKAGSTGIALASGGASIPLQVAGGLTAGYAQDVSNNIEAGKTGTDQLTPGLGTALGVVAPLAGPAISVAKKVPGVVAKTVEGAKNLVPEIPAIKSQAIAESLMTKVARVTPKEAQDFNKLTGKSVGQYLAESGNFEAPDKIIVNEAKKFAQAKEAKDTALASLPGSFKNGALSDAVDELLIKAEKTSGKNVKSPYLSKVSELKSKLDSQGLTMAEMNDLKRLYETQVKLGYNKTLNPDLVERATNIDKEIVSFQDKTAKDLGFSNLPELNKQIQASKFIADKLGSSLIKNDLLNNVSLTDWVILSGGNPANVAGLITKKLFSSKGVQAKIAKTLGNKVIPTEIKAVIKKSFNSGTVPKTVEELVKNAQKYNPEFIKNVDSIAKELGFKVAHGPVKKVVRIQDKINIGEVTLETARDTNRSTILANSPSDLQNIRAKILKQFGNESRFKDKFDTSHDYKSAIINIKTPAGHEAEIAVTTPNMWKAKTELGGQDLYDIIRDKSGIYSPELVAESLAKMKMLYQEAAIADGLIH